MGKSRRSRLPSAVSVTPHPCNEYSWEMGSASSLGMQLIPCSDRRHRSGSKLSLEQSSDS